jgi:protein-tyrosine phosphatase
MPGSEVDSIIKVLMVCLGNICRSPTAHGVLQHRIDQHQLQQQLQVDSAGTGDWHIGHPPDHRACVAANSRGYDLSQLRARQVQISDFYEFDYLLAMDHENLQGLLDMQPDDANCTVELFLTYSQSDERAVPDPYYVGDDGFEVVLDMVEDAVDRLIVELQQRHFSPSL